MLGERATALTARARGGRRPAWAVAAAAVYGALLAAVLLLPIKWLPGVGTWRHIDKPQLRPFHGLLGGHGASSLVMLADLGGNVLLFVPFGFLLPLLAPGLRRWWRTVAVACAASVAVELLQLLWPGIRLADINDVLTNTAGALLGWAAYRLLPAAPDEAASRPADGGGAGGPLPPAGRDARR